MSAAEVITGSACRNTAVGEPPTCTGDPVKDPVAFADGDRSDANTIGSLAPSVTGISSAEVIVGSVCHGSAARAPPTSADGSVIGPVRSADRGGSDSNTIG
jgi:hypothetical protein